MADVNKKRDCSICGKPIAEEPPGWFGGHNAQPINNGRCCRSCNDTVVIPERITRITRGEPVY